MTKELRDDQINQLDHKRVAVVKVSASWCGPCKILNPHFHKWSEKYKVYKGEEISYYELDADRNKEFVRTHNIDRYPTTVFFVHGVPVLKQYGVTRFAVFEKLLDSVLKLKFERKPADDKYDETAKTDGEV